MASGLRTAARPHATWPTFLPLPALSIDHVLLAGDIAAVDGGRRSSDPGSDHFGLVSELAVALRR